MTCLNCLTPIPPDFTTCRCGMPRWLVLGVLDGRIDLEDAQEGWNSESDSQEPVKILTNAN